MNETQPTSTLDSAEIPPPVATPLFAKDAILDNTYRIIDGLAAGGVGEVYRAMHLRLPRPLAIKTLQTEFATRQEWVARFCREACVLGQLRHPNIVQVVDFNVAANGVPYIAMELIEGSDLGAALLEGRRFEATEIVSIVRQVASALDAAHTAGVVHRDLKPENIVLAPAPGQPPVVKVIDFGLSMSDQSPRVTRDCTVFGTPAYMAPEQAQGFRDQVDGRTDQFALAAVAYTLLSGRAPYRRETPVAVLYAVVHEDPEALGSVEGWDSAPIEAVLRRGMARERDDRFPSVLAFADAFEAALIEGGAISRPTTPAPLFLVPTPDPSQPSQPSTRRLRASTTTKRRSSSWKLGVPAAVLGLLVAGALMGGIVRGRSPATTAASWRDGVGVMRTTVMTQWNRLNASSPSPNPEAKNP